MHSMTTHLNILICHTDVVGIGVQIFWRGHHCELDGTLIAESFISPFPDGTNLLDGGNTVVGDQNLGKSLLEWVAPAFSPDQLIGTPQDSPS